LSYSGWKEKHDIWLNLKVDIRRFSFIEMLHEDQIKDGVSLTSDQLTAMVIFVNTGELDANVLTEAAAATKHVQHTPHREASELFHVGQKVDIQDSYKSAAHQAMALKWRPGVVTDIRGCHVHVHYIGWGGEWDEAVDTSLAAERGRLKAGGSRIVPRGTSRDTCQRQIIAASPSARKKKKQQEREREGEGGGVCQEPAKAPVARRRRSLGEASGSGSGTSSGGSGSGGNNNNSSSNNKSSNLDSLVGEALSRKQRSQRGDSGSGGAACRPDVPTKAPRRGMSRTRSFPPLSYDEDTHNEECMLHMYEQQEKDYYTALQQEEAFVASLNQQKLHVVEVDGDGNCLFRAVAHQLWLDEDRHLELRRLCVAHMRKHADRFAVFFEGDFSQHLRGMERPGTWGDDLEIRALEEIADRLVLIYSSLSPLPEPLKTSFDEGRLLQGVAPLKVSYHGENHYNSIFDEAVCLPLEIRPSSVLSDTRHKHLMD
jgi:hypothetical protein